MKKFKEKVGTHVVFKVDDAHKYLNSNERANLEAYLNTMHVGRHQDGKENHEYYVVKKDEPYAQEVFEVIKCGEIKKGGY